MEQRLFAFWTYSPGWGWLKKCCGGEVSSFLENGYVACKNMVGYKMKPFKIMIYEEGIEIMDKLCSLENEYRRELKVLKEKYDKLHDEIIKVPKE